MSKEIKEYIFNNTVTITEETTIEANSYAEAVELFLAGGGDTEEISCNGDNWDCVLNADDFENDKENEDKKPTLKDYLEYVDEHMTNEDNMQDKMQEWTLQEFQIYFGHTTNEENEDETNQR